MSFILLIWCIILIDFQMLNQSSWHNSPSVSNICYMLWNSLQFCLGSFFCIHEWHYFTVFISCHVFCSRAVVQSLSAVQLFVTPWTAACQAPLSFTVSQSLPKSMSIESVMLSNHLILCCPLLLLPSVFPKIVFPGGSDS